MAWEKRFEIEVNKVLADALRDWLSNPAAGPGEVQNDGEEKRIFYRRLPDGGVVFSFETVRPE